MARCFLPLSTQQICAYFEVDGLFGGCLRAHLSWHHGHCSGSRSDVLSLDACLSKCMVDAGNTVFVEREPLETLLSSSGSRSDALSLDACRSVDARNTVFVERNLLGCALARRLSVQMHVRRWKHCFRRAEAFGRHTGQAEVRDH